MTPDALFWLTFGPALAAAVFALVADGFGKRTSSYGTLAAAALLGAGGLVGLIGGQFNPIATAADVFKVGQGYSTVAGLVVLLSAAALVGSVGTRFGEGGQGAALVSLAALGSGLAASSSDLLVTLLCLETSAVCGYALVAIGRGRGARESALKYFIQGAVTSGLFVMGVSALAAGASGDLSYEMLAPLAASLPTPLPVLAAAFLVILGLSFKVGSAPFHSWTADAYQHAPASGAAVLAGPVKLAAMTALGGFVLAFARPGESAFAADSFVSDVAIVLVVLAVLSVLVGSITALAQTSLRRMLGYAGVAQAGYALMAIAAFNPSAAVIHLSMYAVASVAVFVAADAFTAARPGWDGSIRGLAGLGRRDPVLGGAVTLALASLAGLPPVAGFWGKLQAFMAPLTAAVSMEQQGIGWAVWMYGVLVLAGVVGSVVSLAYYGSVIRQLFFVSAEVAEGAQRVVDDADTERPASVTAARGTVIVCSLILLAAGIAPLFTGLSNALAGFLLTR